MDEKLLRKLSRQLKFLNFFIGLFGILLLAGMAIIGFLLWQMITFVHSVDQKIEHTKEKLDVRGQACSSDRLGDFLRQNSEICSEANKK